jgi:dCMP deaminase
MKYERISKDEYYLNIAQEISKRSTCLRRHYGCVIVNDDIIIATGYNGSPRGEENCCDRGFCKRANAERYAGYENCDAVHAEQNAIIATERQKLEGATVYLACETVNEGEKEYTFTEDINPVPCGICARMLENSNVARIVNRSGEVKL